MTPNAEPAPRDHAIDAFRYALAFQVVLLHALPEPDRASADDALLTMACRAAVPFFFIASGYFLPRHGTPVAEAVLRPLRRLVPVHAFWLAAYVCLFAAWQPWSFGLRDLVSGGVAYHLWFLPALGFGLVLVQVLRRLVGLGAAGLACAALALAGLARGAYHDVLGLPGEAARGGLLMAPFFVWIGTALARRAVASGWRTMLAALAAAYALLVAEEMLIMRLADAPRLVSHDFTLATFPLGIATFLLVRALPETRWVRRMAGLGQVSLSVYAVHLLFIWWLSAWLDREQLGQALLLALAVLGLSTAISLLLVRVPTLRPFVT